MRDEDMEAPIEIVEDQIEAMIGATIEDRIEDTTEVTEGIMTEGVTQIGDTMTTEEEETILVEDTMTETIVTDETMVLAEDMMIEIIVTEETMVLAEDTTIATPLRKVPPHCPPVMIYTKRCGDENEQT